MRVRGFRFIVSLFVPVALAILPAACTADQPEETTDIAAEGAEKRDNAFVRFVNATAYDDPVDLYLGQAEAISDVAKDRVTEYSEWPAEVQQIELRSNDQAQAVAMNSETLGAGERYTVVGFSKAGGMPEVAVFQDEASQPGAGKARLRLIHVADGAEELDVYPAGSQESIVEGVNFNADSYAEVDPGVRTLEVRREGAPALTLMVPDLNLEAGKTHTIIVASAPDKKLRAIQVTDRWIGSAPQGYQTGSVAP